MDNRITLIRCLPQQSPAGLRHYEIKMVAGPRRETISVIARTGIDAVQVARATFDDQQMQVAA